MKRIVLHKGAIFGRLTIIEFAGVNQLGKSTYRCLCECDNEITAVVSDITSGHTNSCGCLFKELRAQGAGPKTHGLSRTAEHVAWKNMRQRCTNKRHPKYPDYGGRGIIVCDQWREFETFLKDMGNKPPEGYDQGGHALSVDRINNNGNYEPGNCKWSTPHEQKINQRPRRWHRKPKEEAAQTASL